MFEGGGKKEEKKPRDEKCIFLRNRIM
jgi:hypothetical protein